MFVALRFFDYVYERGQRMRVKSRRERLPVLFTSYCLTSMKQSASDTISPFSLKKLCKSRVVIFCFCPESIRMKAFRTTKEWFFARTSFYISQFRMACAYSWMILATSSKVWYDKADIVISFLFLSVSFILIFLIVFSNSIH